MTISELTKNNADLNYPHFVATLSKVASPEMVKMLEKGDCQLVGVLAASGKKAVLRTISLSPNNVRLLLMVVDDLKYNISPTVSIPIKSIEDYMEVV